MSTGSATDRMESDSMEKNGNVDTPTLVVELEPEPHIHIKTLLVVFAICYVYFAQVYNVVGAGAFARDVSAVVGSPGDGVWLAASVTIITMVLSPPVSQAADYWGRKWFLVILTTCGFIGSLIVSRADTMGMAIAGQVVAGLSFGAQPLNHAVPSEVLPRKWRPHAQAAVNVAASAGGLAGLLVGAALTRNDPAGFRVYWYIGAALYGVSAIICLALYNPPPRELQRSLTASQKLRLLDWPGYALLAAGLVLICVGLSWAENPYGWRDAHVLGTLLVGVAFVGALTLYETRFTTQGMFHHELFQRGRNYAIALGCVFVDGMVFFATNNYFAFQVSTMYDTDALVISTRYAITFIVYFVCTLAAGAFCSAYKIVRLPAVLGFASFVVFFVLMATSTPHSSLHVWGYPAFLGFGLGLSLCSLVTAGQLCTPPELISLASGLLIGVRSFGGSIGLAIYNAIFSTTLSSQLAPTIATAVLPLGLPAASLAQLIPALSAHNATALAAVPGVTPDILLAADAALKDAYMVAFRWVWVAAGCFSFVALVASLFFVDPKSDFTPKIDAAAESEEELFRHAKGGGR